jgi:hypothetical protein
LVTLLGPGTLGREPYRRGIQWLLHQAGAESSFLNRLRLFLTGTPPPPEQSFSGWPWFPGAGAWVTPTALSLLALRKALRSEPSTEIRGRLEMGSLFLLNRMCSDGGWNYGSARAFGYDAPSYPETTGVALLALHGTRSGRIAMACRLAQAQLRTCRTSEAESWLRLGLLAHARLPVDTPAPVCPQRTVPHAALALLASAAARGRNVFLD